MPPNMRPVSLVPVFLLLALALGTAGCSGEGSRSAASTVTETSAATPGASTDAGDPPSSTDAQRSEQPDALPETVGIVTPSGNISCAAVVSRLHTTMRCTISETSGPDLPRPRGEQGCDWLGGRVFSLGGKGAGARIAPCDALADSSPQTLAYGRVWQYGPFRCLSTRLALVCTNAQGHGLLLSRDQQRTF